MSSKEKGMLQLDNVRLELRVKHHNIFQDLYLNLSLLVELRLVSNNLQSDELSFLMVKGLEHLSKRSLAKTIHNLISIGYRITSRYLSLTGAACEIFDGMYPSWSNVMHFIPKNLFSFQLSQKGVLLFFLIFFDRYGSASFLQFYLFLLIWTIELNQRIFTFSVCILSDLNLDFFSTDYD